MALKIGGRGDIPAFMVMEVMRAAAARESAGQPVYHMEVGQPGSSAPKGVREAAKRALDDNRIGYTVALGLPALREAIARHYWHLYRVSVPAERIVVTTGSSTGFILSFLAAFDPGDRVALAAPGYPCYRHILTALGITPVILNATLEDRFQPTPELIRQAHAEAPLDGIIVASPSNPTGTMLDRTALTALCDTCRALGIRVVSDEIYHGICFAGPPITAVAGEPNAIVVNSFSKYFSMTGWRLGWLVMPEELVRPVECLSQNLFISPPTLSQIAGIAAFDCYEELEQNVGRYRANRDILMEGLPKAGFPSFAPPDGAFYIYADVRDRTQDSKSFCAAVLEKTGVAITPGSDFDAARGQHYVRFSYAETEPVICAALKALKAL